MSSRERILGRVRRALADVEQDDRPYEQAFARDYLREHGDLDVEQRVDLLAENLADYRAIVHRCTAADLAATIAGMLAARGSRTVLGPPGLDPEWLSAAEAERLADRAESTPYELDRVDSVVTACAVAVAETGTIVLDGSPDQGRRRITLVPDHHVVVVRVPEQVVSSVPQALERLDPARPLTWISGPSATSDIELDRVEGVHGPRTLEVVLVTA
ncbi:LutC/YkgG family protein [Streptomyces resistomycificus]|uniref:Lactate utilization protein B/C n=1 Tax=Streptomyces resistomycificus TaxID=67356 RepID=A0A0L8LU76_9ACTN|nr:LUD domain-containing protein [Streptomyces resistomycificus]KOG41733.1 lactate utilization protein B/C [Streptomyces resistomycificus]KUN95841.1 lactate utilization protein B/C [Streptomyces resistomycificus]